jgi:predicted PurR-regulated permease PerM
MSPTLSQPTRYVVAIGLALFGIFVLYLSRAVLPLLVMAAVLSFLALPLINLLHQRFGVRRGLAVILTYLLGLLGLVVALLFIIPAIINAVQFVLDLEYGALLARATEATRAWLERLQAADIPYEPLDRALEEAATTLLGYLAGAVPVVGEESSINVAAILQQMGTVVVGSFNLLSGVVGTVFSQLLTSLLVLLLSLYISMDAHRLRGRVLAIFPEAYQPEVEILWRRVQRVWRLFLRGQLTLMVLIGAIVWLGLTLLGLPHALPLAIVAGLLEIVPSLGPVLATIPAVLVALLEGSTVLGLSPLVFALVIVLFYALVQQIENTIVVPRVLGEAVDLQPVVVMAGILIGASVGGILGALLAVPVIASVREIVSYLHRKVLERDPFPVEEEVPPSDPRRSWRRRARVLLWRLRKRVQARASAAKPVAKG